MRSALITGLVAVTALGLTSCREQPEVAGPTPITRETLAGTECVAWTGGLSRFAWSFSDGTFRIEAGTDPIPRELIDELVGDGREAKLIEGTWRLDGVSLYLSDVKADGQPTGQEGLLSAADTGAIRLSVARRSREQYTFDRRSPPAK